MIIESPRLDQWHVVEMLTPGIHFALHEYYVLRGIATYVVWPCVSAQTDSAMGEMALTRVGVW